MKISVIVPTYKDVVALRIILDALNRQSYDSFDIVVAEDNNSKEVKEFLNSYNSKHKIYHIYHKDFKNRKATILNKALSIIKSDYLIFIDGDCIPFVDFVSNHIYLSRKTSVLCGRRVNLSKDISNDIRDDILNPYELEKRYFKNILFMKNRGTRHIEQGIVINPKSIFYRLIQKLNRNIHIVGSNFSCFKSDIDYINGFDEDIVGGMKDDVDLEWRFVMSGCKLEICKYSANLFHLYHTREDRTSDEDISREQMKINQENNRFICTNGIVKKENNVS